MYEVKVLNPYTKEVHAISTDELYMDYKYEGLEGVTVVTKDGYREVSAEQLFTAYVSPLEIVDSVLPRIEAYSKMLGLSFKFKVGVNLVIGSGMRNPYRIEAKGSKGVPMLVLNQNIFKTKADVKLYFASPKILYLTIDNTYMGALSPYGQLLNGVGAYVYDTLLYPKLKGRRESSLPFRLMDKEKFICYFADLYVHTALKGVGVTQKRLGMCGELQDFIACVLYM